MRPLTPDSPSDYPPTGIGDHQLGQRLGVLLAQQAASNLPYSSINSQLQDVLGDDTALLGPLRDLLGRPTFRQLVGLDRHSVLVGSRDALLQELGQTYNTLMVERLAAVIDGCIGLPPGPVPSAAPAGAWGWGAAQGSPPAQPSQWAAPPPQNASPYSVPQAPVQPVPPPASSRASGVTALLIALCSMLSGAVLLGLGWLLLSSRPTLISGSTTAPSTDKAPSTAARPASPAPAPPPPATPKAPAPDNNTPGAWGDASAYKFGQLPGGDYPNSCAFSETDASGRVTTANKSNLEYWACRDVGGDPETGYRVVWADGKETTYTFRPDGGGMVVGTNGTSYPMRWSNDSHQGSDIVVINHQDGAISWIPGNITSSSD